MKIALGRQWKLIPLHSPIDGGCSCKKSACSSVGKHPRIADWPSKAASSDVEITKWWEQWPNANIGVVTGSQSGVFVLDVDGDAGGNSLRTLESIHSPLPQTLTALTGRGRHFYFRHPGIPIKCSTGKLGDGLDVRGDGGYVVAPPSIHASGRRYEWQDSTAEIEDAPAWLLELLTVEDVERAPIEELIPEGKRNPWLFEQVGALFRTGQTREQVLESALALNQHRCSPPIEVEKVRSIVERVAGTHKPNTGRKSKKNPLSWFPFDVADFLGDQHVQTLKDYQIGWRTLLTAYAWVSHGYLVNDVAKLSVLARASSKKKFAAEMHVALFDFEPVERDGKPCLLNREMAGEYAGKLAAWNQKKEAGLARASAKGKKNIEIEMEATV